MKQYIKVSVGNYELLIEVKVLEENEAYGRTIVTAKPVSGQGSVKVNKEKIIEK